MSKETSITVSVSPRLGARATAIILVAWQYLFGRVPERLVKSLFSFKVRA